MNVCFNAVALSFILEIENFAYSFALRDATRVEFERDHQLSIRTADGILLNRVKVLYVVLTQIAVVFYLTAVEYSGTTVFPYMALIYGFSPIAQIAEFLAGVTACDIRRCGIFVLKYAISLIVLDPNLLTRVG